MSWCPHYTSPSSASPCNAQKPRWVRAQQQNCDAETKACGFSTLEQDALSSILILTAPSRAGAHHREHQGKLWTVRALHHRALGTVESFASRRALHRALSSWRALHHCKLGTMVSLAPQRALQHRELCTKGSFALHGALQNPLHAFFPSIGAGSTPSPIPTPHTPRLCL